MTDDNWTRLHETYKQQDWITKPSMFAEVAITYFPESGKLLELGAGVGQDSLYFASHGYDVTATDLNTDKLNSNDELQVQGRSVEVRQVDLLQPLPFEDDSYDVVYAHLSLHYFDDATTQRIFADMYRVLKPGGIIAFFTNSTSDPEYGTGKQIEPDYFEIDGVRKRYLDVDTAAQYAKAFETLLIDNDGETYKDAAIGVHNLIRYVGRKQA